MNYEGDAVYLTSKDPEPRIGSIIIEDLGGGVAIPWKRYTTGWLAAGQEGPGEDWAQVVLDGAEINPLTGQEPATRYYLVHAGWEG